MKKKVLIVTAVIIANILAFSLKSQAQERDKCPSLPVLIADETTLNEGKTGAKIETNSDTVFYKIYKRFKAQITRCGWTRKKDRHGYYKCYAITIDKEIIEQFKIWASKNL